jgi:mono/diheme cytochrome c family protein
MNELFDILLSKPLSDLFSHGLLFVAFTLHILFVLLALGTAIIALYYFVHAWWGGRLNEVRWDKKILRTFLAHKSLAVVLGVAPLLLIQIVASIPFFTGINLFAPFWLLIIPFLIVSFLSFDALGHKIYVHHYLHMIFGVIALIFLLAVPGIFVAVLVTAENSDKWTTIIAHGYRLSDSLTYHWLFRYLHVLGASLVFGAAFHYFFSTKDERGEKSSLLKWIVAGILIQFVLGIILYSSLLEKPDNITNASLFIGITAAAVLLWLIFSIINKSSAISIKVALPIFMIILVPMLLARQCIQDTKFMPLDKQLETNAQAYQKTLQPYNMEALDKYQSDITIVYDNGKTIYLKSCAFCHGEKADGNGSEAKNLAIFPEDISAIRTARQYLHTILTGGVTGSAMPYFTVFDRYKLDSLIDYLDKKYHVLSLPEPLPVKITDAALQQSRKIYDETCSQCHGIDGRGSTLSKGFQPPPPDFTVYSLSPERAFEVITKGYSGTVMSPFSNLPKDVRWGLVKIINDKRTK